mgnify:CR=1 FL=1
MIFDISAIDQEVESCLYKLFCGKKYIIVKGKTLAGSVYLIQKGYAYFIAGGGRKGNKAGDGHKEGSGTNTYYFNFYKHIKKNPTQEVRIEIILESNNPYQLLKIEQIELTKSFKDKNNLNNNITSYIPKYRTATKSYGWIPKSAVLNYKKFLKNM